MEQKKPFLQGLGSHGFVTRETSSSECWLGSEEKEYTRLVLLVYYYKLLVNSDSEKQCSLEAAGVMMSHIAVAECVEFLHLLSN